MKTETLWLWSFWRNFKLRIFWLVLLTLLKVIFFLSYPIFFKWIIDGIKTGLTQRELLQYVGGLLFAGVASAGMYILLQTNRALMNTTMEQVIRNRLFKTMLQKDLAFFKRFPVGDVITRLLDDISEEKLTWFACSGIFRAVEAAFTFLIMCLILYALSPFLTLVSVLPLIFITLLFMIAEKKLHEFYHEVQQSITTVNSFLESCFSGIRVVKAYAAEHLQEGFFGTAVRQRVSAEIKLARMDAGLHQSYWLMNRFGILMVLWAGGNMVIRNELTLGDFVAFSTYILMIIEPMISIGMFFTSGKRASVVAGRLMDMENTEPVVRPPDQGVVLDRFESLRFRSLSFQYGENLPPALENIDATVRAGEVVAFAGAVGSGKSTLNHLVLRFADPTSGAILINGHDLRTIDLDSWRSRVAWVPQEALLFSDTIAANVLFERPHRGAEAVQTALEQAQIWDEVRSFSHGVEERVGQRGLTLSGGQKQRTALARALYGNPEVLILDDLTAAVDARTEEALWQALLARRPRPTILLMAHRWATLQKAERILVLDRGRVVEEGHPQDLLQAKGHLYRLINQESMLRPD